MIGLVLGLPRSRTAWVSAYLTVVHQRHGPVTHEALVDEFKGDRTAYEWAATDWKGWIDCTTDYRAGEHVVRDTPIVFIDRGISFVRDSLMLLSNNREGVFIPTRPELELARETCISYATIHVAFDKLDERMPVICDCLGLPYDGDAHRRLAKLNITTTRVTV